MVAERGERGETYGEHPDGVDGKLVQISVSHDGRCLCGGSKKLVSREKSGDEGGVL
jgi:hypothetical protein